MNIYLGRSNKCDIALFDKFVTVLKQRGHQIFTYGDKIPELDLVVVIPAEDSTSGSFYQWVGRGIFDDARRKGVKKVIYNNSTCKLHEVTGHDTRINGNDWKINYGKVLHNTEPTTIETNKKGTKLYVVKKICESNS